ncbi:unnamed protein product [Vicia faba]|uniref:Uncharacterized protein n=1 Tax=Vicia faba TaxID=3906 RepID=A0AAV1A8W2_VICFA|nr:unnamed protein product [Vicia faba]
MKTSRRCNLQTTVYNPAIQDESLISDYNEPNSHILFGFNVPKKNTLGKEKIDGSSFAYTSSSLLPLRTAQQPWPLSSSSKRDGTNFQIEVLEEDAATTKPSTSFFEDEGSLKRMKMMQIMAGLAYGGFLTMKLNEHED